MGHLHSASGCPCCEDMGITVRPQLSSQQAAPQQAADRVSTAGLDHIYEEHVEVTVLQEEPGIQPESQSVKELGHLTSLIRQQAQSLMEQAGKLESANYRIGYLEAQVTHKDEELRLLCDRRQSGWARSFSRWFFQ
jgi:hypothetical protein